MNEENCQAMLEHFSIRIYSLQKEFDAYKNDQMIQSDERKAAMFDRYHRIRALKLELLYLKLIWNKQAQKRAFCSCLIF